MLYREALGAETRQLPPTYLSYHVSRYLINNLYHEKELAGTAVGKIIGGTY